MAVQMKIIGSSQQVHGKNKSHQSQVMIAMEMADKDVINAMKVGLKPHELHLGSFATIHQEIPVLDLDQL
jgi:hypothetical protein